ncbi:hypothetical protein E4U13_004509 [Claviceps humidiphila]|uniref:Uncharacterized protein n=1 Tax=Claviceps humidiphila TaxID=1294629 RepID=A0A9P7TT23_9HYPO|nr:hypothetical protein E4U13_004509 [Claviceps humidiphila]
MSYQSQRDREVFLRDPHDWMDWRIYIEGRAANWNIRDKMNPDMPDIVFLARPTLPEKPKLSEYDRLTELHVATRPSHLTPEGLAAFEEDMAFYEEDMASYEKSGGDPGFKQDCRDYENEQKAVHHMTELIQSTVAEHFQRACCLPGLDLKQWMANLRLLCEILV